MDTRLGFFDYLEQDPKAVKDFDTFMIGSTRGRAIWVDWFPVQERILDGYRPGDNQAGEIHSNDVLIVDIGGGRGQDLEMFKKKFPEAPGSMVLEDLPRTVVEAKLSAGMKAIPYDFFTPQPVKGARTYFFHKVMHNWPDHLAATILSNTASAMIPGYSKLILNEYILPATECPLSPSWADFHMMAGLAACERTEKQFHALVASAGLKVVKFWYPEGAIEGIVEVMLDDEGLAASNGVGEVVRDGHREAGESNGYTQV